MWRVIRLPSVVEVAADAFGELGAVVGEHLLEGLQPLGQHVAHHVAARGDGVREHLGVVAEVLGDVVAARDDGLGDLVAGLLELGDHVAAAQAEVEDDGFAGGAQRVVDLLGAHRDGLGEPAGGVDELPRHHLGAVRDRIGEFARLGLDDLEHRRGLAGKALDHAVEPSCQRLLQVGRDFEELLVEGVGLEVEAGGQAVARGVDRARRVVAGALQALQQVGAALAKLFDHGVAGGAKRDRNLLALLGERAGDALRRLVDAFGDELAHRGDVVGEVEMDVGDGVAHLLGLSDQGFALLGEAVEQVADAQLVVVVGALQRRHFVVDQRLELGGARQRALDAVAHGRDLAADRLADGDDRIAGHAVGLGEAQRRLRHGMGHHAQFLRARQHVGERIEEHDGRDDAEDDAEEGRNRGREVAQEPAQLAAETDHQPDRADDPDGGEQRGDGERDALRPALHRLEDLTDQLLVVIGGVHDLAVVLGRDHRGVDRLFPADRRDAGNAAAAVARGLGRGCDRRRDRRGGVGVAHIERVLDRRKRDLGGVFALLGVDRHVGPPHKLRHSRGLWATVRAHAPMRDVQPAQRRGGIRQSRSHPQHPHFTPQQGINETE